jgi:hypothetical protein
MEDEPLSRQADDKTQENPQGQAAEPAEPKPKRWEDMTEEERDAALRRADIINEQRNRSRRRGF